MQSSAPGSRSAAELDEWFDNVDLEKSIELQKLDQDVSGIRIEIPGGNRDPDLVRLVDSVNEPSRHSQEQYHQNITYLAEYIGRLAQEKEEEAKSKQDQAERAERLSRNRQEKRTRASQRLHRFARTIRSSMKKAFVLVLSVLKGGMKLLDSVSFIAAELTFQTHYQVAVKAIMLFITAYESSGKLTEDIISVFDKIDDYVKEMQALQQNIKSTAMSKAISKLFVAIVAFIVSAGSYMKHNKLHKMVTQLGGRNEKFQEHMNEVNTAYDEVQRVMKFAEVMINLSSLKHIRDVGHDMTEVIRQLSLLNSSLPPAMSTQLREVHDHTRFHAELHIQTLRAKLFDSAYEPSEEMAFNDKERKFLSPHGRWQRQFRLPPGTSSLTETPSTWPGTRGRTTSRPLLWISGPVSRRNVSWVSSLCVDLITHYRSFSNFEIAYVFCKRGQGPRYTPTLLIKGLVAQLLEAHPTIAMRNLRRLSLERLGGIGPDARPGSALLAWRLLEDTLRLMEEAPELRDRVMLLLIDRLDLCVAEEGFSVLDGLIPRLQALGHQRARVQVLVTTARLSALAVPTLRRGSEWLQAYGKKSHG